MNRRRSFIHLNNFIIYIILQIILGQFLFSFHKASCFIYIGFFLPLPLQRSRLSLQLLLGFLVGLIIDGFYDSLGIHAFSAVLLIYFRSFLLHIFSLSITNNYTYTINPTLVYMGLKKNFIYTFFLVSIYHVTVFFLNSLCNNSFINILSFQIIISIVISFLFIFTSQIFFAIIRSDNLVT